MCGVIGLVGERPDAAGLDTGVESLRHRGPDDSGAIVLDDAVFLGHTRLRILDLSPAGRQPMRNEDGSVWITYNGEIYNHRELRAGLVQRGHRFQSRTDTEVIVHLYEERGINCVDELNGMFAFAIYDRRRRRVLLARDRLGIKPLYYALQNGTLAFASEIKALLAAGLAPAEVDWQAIYDYFSLLYIPHPRTAFTHIRQLPPAHHLVFDLTGRTAQVACYWRPDGHGARRRPSADLAAEVRALLADAVARQMVADVPVGLFLSGGVDSSVLAALMAEHGGGPLRTFTVRFTGAGSKPHDDTEYARRMSRAVGSQHAEIVVDISNPEELLDLVRCFDQPFGNPTFYLSYLISKATRAEVTVALSGAGGDELFGGYPRYRALPYAGLLSRLPRTLNRPVAHALEWLKEDADTPWPRRLKLFARGIGQPLPEQYLRWTYYLDDAGKRRLLRPLLARNGALRPAARVLSDHLDDANGAPILERFQYLDLKTFLVDNILQYTDATSMAVALEVRVPFLDHRLVELGLRLPAREKIRGRTTKAILQSAFRDLIPAENLAAPKRGFCPPIAAWMEKHFDAYFDHVLTQREVAREEIFDWDALQALRAQHKARRRDNSMELFSIVMFDAWYRRYVQQGRSA